MLKQKVGGIELSTAVALFSLSEFAIQRMGKPPASTRLFRQNSRKLDFLWAASGSCPVTVPRISCRWPITRFSPSKCHKDKPKYFKLSSVPCAPHIVHNAVVDALKITRITNVIQKIRIVSKKLNQSPKIRKEFEINSSKVGKSTKMIPNYSNTRWNGVHRMLRIGYDLRGVISATVGLTDYSLNGKDQELIKWLLLCLQPIDGISSKVRIKFSRKKIEFSARIRKFYLLHCYSFPSPHDP